MSCRKMLSAWRTLKVRNKLWHIDGTKVIKTQKSLFKCCAFFTIFSQSKKSSISQNYFESLVRFTTNVKNWHYTKEGICQQNPILKHTLLKLCPRWPGGGDGWGRGSIQFIDDVTQQFRASERVSMFQVVFPDVVLQRVELHAFNTVTRTKID